MCLRSRGRAEFRRRRKSLPPPPAEFWSARRRASRIWFSPAGKVAAARLRGLLVDSSTKTTLVELFLYFKFSGAHKILQYLVRTTSLSCAYGHYSVLCAQSNYLVHTSFISCERDLFRDSCALCTRENFFDVSLRCSQDKTSQTQKGEKQ